MNNSLQQLLLALKKIIWQLKPQHQPLSLLLLTGKHNQGKSALLKQSSLQQIRIESEPKVELFYNSLGIIIELDEAWLHNSTDLLQNAFKKINKVHPNVKISGLIFCIDMNELILHEPMDFVEHSKQHIQLLRRFGQNLNYKVDLAFLFTKVDALAGFCDFFQYESPASLTQALGFSLGKTPKEGKLVDGFRHKFDEFIEMLGQQVIHKLHPARSSLKRTLIREFPLQMASLRLAIQTLIAQVSVQWFDIAAFYFTSAEQGGVSLDRLNKKIQNEYALVVQDAFPQSNNYQAYFIEGALRAFQESTKHYSRNGWGSHPYIIASGTVLTLCLLSNILYQHIKSSELLDKASKDLIVYEQLVKNNHSTNALYYLNKATHSLNLISTHPIGNSTVRYLKKQIGANTKHYLKGNFLPAVLGEIEQTLTNQTLSPHDRYQALKIYIMLSSRERFSQHEVLNWFKQLWQQEASHMGASDLDSNASQELQRKLALLKQALGQPLQPITINQQIVSDVRNYLNALPVSYLYYSFAKQQFPKDIIPIHLDGFDTPESSLPLYFTKNGFKHIIQFLPELSKQLQADNWILARQDLNQLPILLQEAYCFEYVTWWQNFIRRTLPMHFQTYAQAQKLTQTLQQSQTMTKLVELIQQETSPEFGEHGTIFNQEIASKFASLSLLSHTALYELSANLSDLERFLTTFSVVADNGKTAFTITKSRFEGDTIASPISNLYTRVQHLPEPVSIWMKQIADDAWFLLINDSRTYINQQWKQVIVPEFKHHIANRFPFESNQNEEVALNHFDRFFAPSGLLNQFFNDYLKAFVDVSKPEWQPKEVNSYVLPIATETLNEFIRANVITNMFFPDHTDHSRVEFSLQKISLDPIVEKLKLKLGENKLLDDQNTEASMEFVWPLNNASLIIRSIEGNSYDLNETGWWAFFKMLQKVNVLVDEHDSASLQILFEINGNSGRYVLKTQNQINPFTPGILNGFTLPEEIV